MSHRNWRKKFHIHDEDKSHMTSNEEHEVRETSDLDFAAEEDKKTNSNGRNLSNALGLESTGVDDDEYYHENSKIDYTNAFLKEHKHAQEILSRLRPDRLTDFDKVHLGFTKLNYDDDEMDLLAKKQFVFDVLPSFEMLHSMQNTGIRTVYDNPDEHDFPPDYFSNNIHKIYGVTGTDEFQRLTLTATPTNTSSMSLTTTPSSSDIQSDSAGTPNPIDESMSVESFEKNLFNKSHLLPNMNLSTLEISVHVTKDVPCPLKACEAESMLKEYTSGDVVHGCVIVNNTSPKPQKFQMFHVTLEGYSLVTDPETKRMNQKRFLEMVDISASWTYGAVSPSANFNYEPYALDHEGCLLGLPNDRIIPPRTKYKKFFAFKIPYKLLDNSCQHDLEIHTLLPPSFGIDRVKNRGENMNIDIDPMLNYGHSGIKGSPILTQDLSGNNKAISYGIHARMISFHPNKPKKLCILKQHEHNLRFIPYGFATPLFSSKSALDNLTSQIEHAFEIARHVLEMKKKDKDVSQQEEDDFIRLLKCRQLQSVSSSSNSNSRRPNDDDNAFPLRNKNFGNRDFSRVEVICKYIKDGPNGGSSFLKNLKLGSTKKVSDVASKGSGLIRISTRIPKDGLPYISPSLMRKANEVSNLNELGSKNLDNLSSALSANEKKKLSFLKLNLSFTPSDFNSESMDLPELKSVKASLLASNMSSTAPIPIKLSADFFAWKESFKIKSRFKKIDDEYNTLLGQFQEYDLDLDRHIDKHLRRDIVAMKDLQVESTIVDAFNYSIKSQTAWESSEVNQEWTKQIELNLDLKNSITETLVPNFQTCLLSRVYSIQLSFKFKNGHKCELIVPIRIRSFDDL